RDERALDQMVTTRDRDVDRAGAPITTEVERVRPWQELHAGGVGRPAAGVPADWRTVRQIELAGLEVDRRQGRRHDDAALLLHRRVVVHADADGATGEQLLAHCPTNGLTAAECSPATGVDSDMAGVERLIVGVPEIDGHERGLEREVR